MTTPPHRLPNAIYMDVWVVVVELACPDTPGPFRVAHLAALVDELAGWEASGLWSEDRYAVQLHVPAPGPHHALRVALGFYRQALRSVGLPDSKLIRIEVLTSEEMCRSCEELGHDQISVAPAPAVGSALHSPQAYVATRALVAAATAADIARVVDDFVVAIGARVQPGPPLHHEDMTEVELDGDGCAPRHAIAEALSMSGLLLEQALPNLLFDARHALARLQPRDACPRPALLLETDDPRVVERS